MTSALKVLDAGPYTTFQDMGRMGYQDVGVPVSGAVDKVSARLANVLVGNPPGAAVLEMLLQGMSFEVQASAARVALFGCDGQLAVTGARRLSVPAGRSVRLVRGDVVKVTSLGRSLSGYLALEGGFDLPMQLGSASTYVRGGIGGLQGRVLQRGDILPLAAPDVDVRSEKELAAPYDYGYSQAIRVVLGPQDDYFTPQARHVFFSGEYVVSDKADRMGFRLDGPALEHADGYDLVSDGIVSGAIQVPGSGLPIVLLADAQTTGGYPKIATVISSDISVLARRRPGSAVRFEQVSLEEAEALARDLHARLCNIAEYGLREVAPAGVIDLAALRTENLTSGVV
ncbi:biotin-dependent carboxyltransferase family protein [Pusillimonas caeni]|uniref:5-oxoprolinase subunit C family protein n=1 Tax=Pusillimonas caeni TaxID=1348472 RepID=UPI000E59C3C8|nr:biotin-dependent carboxyltransferase family protein [Pusillimonas caeni]TFL08812.1 biotin-dependent carboxyltransferase family protein [Pusillimonas caeni]